MLLVVFSFFHFVKRHLDSFLRYGNDYLLYKPNFMIYEDETIQDWEISAYAGMTPSLSFPQRRESPSIRICNPNVLNIWIYNTYFALQMLNTRDLLNYKLSNTGKFIVNCSLLNIFL